MNIKFALAGNPNCGKTTMFNALTGANQYVGNWPGVTVEKKEGKVKVKGNKEDNITVVDLPGIYSLSPYTLEEVVSRDFLLNEDPDVIIDLVDATNIERNLYLTTQLIETGVPVVVALNMADLIEKRGLKIDTKRLSMVLGCPIIETSALKGTGLKELIAEAVKVAKQSEHQLPGAIFSEKIEKAIDTVVPALSETIAANKKRWYAVKVLENDEKVMILFGAPGSVMIGTDKSYTGNLVQICGGNNVFNEGNSSYIQVNMEEIINANPDKILVTMHALPDETKKTVAEELAKDSWKSINAVKNNKVIYLDSEYFGMSANLKVIEALDLLGDILYEQ